MTYHQYHMARFPSLAPACAFVDLFFFLPFRLPFFFFLLLLRSSSTQWDACWYRLVVRCRTTITRRKGKNRILASTWTAAASIFPHLHRFTFHAIHAFDAFVICIFFFGLRWMRYAHKLPFLLVARCSSSFRRNSSESESKSKRLPVADGGCYCFVWFYYLATHLCTRTSAPPIDRSHLVCHLIFFVLFLLCVRARADFANINSNWTVCIRTLVGRFIRFTDFRNSCVLVRCATVKSEIICTKEEKSGIERFAWWAGDDCQPLSISDDDDTNQSVSFTPFSAKRWHARDDHKIV